MLHPRRVIFLHRDRDESLPHGALADLPSPQEMHRRIQRERRLYDRGRPSFSVVVFDVGNPEVDSGPAVRLVQGFLHRARACDEIGWFGRQRIAMLLPVTSHSGAHQLAVELSSVVGGGSVRPSFRVFCI